MIAVILNLKYNYSAYDPILLPRSQRNLMRDGDSRRARYAEQFQLLSYLHDHTNQIIVV